MVRESRDNYILRKMREERMDNKTERIIQQLKQENYFLKRNIYDLQEQLQKSYIRIKEFSISLRLILK